MRILFSSHAFAPSTGGLEAVSEILAREFVRQGHDVRLITQTPGSGAEDYPFEVIRRPGATTLFRLVRWSDVFFHNNISLPKAWPLLLLDRPWVVAHHVWLPPSGMAPMLKRFALRHATGIAVSRAIAEHFAIPSTVIPNPYDEMTFRRLNGVARDQDLIFVGRLVSDKGVGLLVDALAGLREAEVTPTLTVVGQGPEESGLKEQCKRLGLCDQVRFPGPLRGQRLAETYNRHRIAVVPSLWNEPFGIVALEAIACGCAVVGSEGGGLPDAIGPCGLSFPNNDLKALTSAMSLLLREPDRLTTYRAAAVSHLARYRPTVIAARYLEVMKVARDDWLAKRSLKQAG